MNVVESIGPAIAEALPKGHSEVNPVDGLLVEIPRELTRAMANFRPVAIGLFVGIDLLFHGITWTVFALGLRSLA